MLCSLVYSSSHNSACRILARQKNCLPETNRKDAGERWVVLMLAITLQCAFLSTNKWRFSLKIKKRCERLECGVIKRKKEILEWYFQISSILTFWGETLLVFCNKKVININFWFNFQNFFGFF